MPAPGHATRGHHRAHPGGAGGRKGAAGEDGGEGGEGPRARPQGRHGAGRKRYGVQGVQLHPLSLVGYTAIPCTWSILSVLLLSRSTSPGSTDLFVPE
jgi:hypothetical protein